MISEQYKELFALVARNGAINGEKAVEVLTKQDVNADVADTLTMTENFRRLEDKIRAGGELDSLDYVYLYVGAAISREVLQKNINTWAAIVHEYDVNLLPRLLEVAKETDIPKQMDLIENFFTEKVDKNQN